MRRDIWTGTSPHIEVNYGLIPGLQVHLLLPMNYNYIPHHSADFGYGNTEFGVKYCFIHETKSSPQVGIFPILEIPTIKNSEFTNGKIQVFLPVWAQKSWGKLTTYVGVGYGINPGATNRNWIFTGAEIQYDFSPGLMLGGELYYHSADADGSKSVTACSIGGSINFSEKFHFIFSVGHSLINDKFTSSYVGLLLTI
jgi:predicted porin